MTIRTEKPKLKFRFPVTDLLSLAKVIQIKFMEYQTAFEAFESIFTETWGTDFLTEIEDVQYMTTPGAHRARLKVFTETMKSSLSMAAEAETELIYFVRKAFPNDEGKLRLFGQKTYLEARRSQSRMIMLMETAAAGFSENISALDAAGYGASKRAVYASRLEDLKDAAVKQEAQKGIMQSGTKEYYSRLNMIYDKLIMLSTAAKFVFPESRAAYDLFRIYHSRPRKKKQAKLKIPLEEAVEGVMNELVNDGMKEK